MIKRKRGLSHLEVILSVILFIGAVGVAFFFFDPASSYKFGEPSYNYIVNAIEDNITTNVTIFGIKPNSKSDEQNVATLGIELKDGKMGLIIIDSEDNGDKIDYDVDQANIGKIKWKSDNFVFIHASDDFPLSDNTPGNDPEVEATIVSVYTKKVISEKRAKSLLIDYNKGYNNYYIIKRFFGISDNVNFGFNLNGMETNIEPPNGMNVISNVKRVEILKEYQNGGDNPNYIFGILSVRIW